MVYTPFNCVVAMLGAYGVGEGRGIEGSQMFGGCKLIVIGTVGYNTALYIISA